MGFLLFLVLLLAFPTQNLAQQPHASLPRAFLTQTSMNNPSHESTPKLAIKVTSTGVCDETYGFFPCTETLLGNLVFLFIYGFLMYKAASMLSEGSELLLVVLDPGVIGGLLLPVIGVLPDTILVAVSGLGGSKAEAQEQVLVGIGLLAGSNVMLLTLLWGTCLILGRCDFEQQPNGKIIAKDKTLTKKCNLLETGVETDNVTRVSARIMTLTVIPYIVAQIPLIFHFSSRKNIPVLIACILSLSAMMAYFIYQVLRPKMHKHRVRWATRRLWKAYILQYLQHFTGFNEPLINSKGNINKQVVEKIFVKIDKDRSGRLSLDEVRVALSVAELDHKLPEEVVENFMKEFDTNRDRFITLEEFESGLEKWCKDVKAKRGLKERITMMEKVLEHDPSLPKEESEDEKPSSRKKLIWKAIFLLIVGMVIAIIFADPLVDTVTQFSRASHIPTFFLSFVLLPLASNASEGVSSIIFSSRKRKVNMSMTYSQIYGGVTMNNTMSLGAFLAIVYGRQLVWEFTSEVLIIALVIIIMGAITSIRKTFPTWMAFVAISFYPLSLAIVAILDYVIGWE